MKLRSTAFFFSLVVSAMPLLRAADTLDLYVLDVEGGKAQILVTPSGQAVLFDAGFPRPNDSELKKVVDAAKKIGIKEFEYMILTHYDVDHAGNAEALSKQIPVKKFVDHGALSIDPNMNPLNTKAFNAYMAFIKDKPEKRLTVKAGDTIPLKDVTVTVLTAGEKVITKPVKGAGQANPACPAEPRPLFQNDDNGGSIGELWEFGAFKFVDFGDLLAWVENRLVCPTNRVGPVDLFLVNHHGVALSNSKELVAALHPKVAIMNNGERKGNSVEVASILKAQQGLQDVWQLHYSPAVATPTNLNSASDFIANLAAKDDKSDWIKVSAKKDGSFTVTNGRNGFSKEYKK